MSRDHSMTLAECEALDDADAKRRRQEACSHKWADVDKGIIRCVDCGGAFQDIDVIVQLLHRVGTLEEELRETRSLIGQ